MDLSAQSRFVRAFTLPQISWEPVINLGFLTAAPIAFDPPPFGNFYPNDGGPTRLFNNSVELVPVAPIPVADFLIKDFEDPSRSKGFTGALFTLPFGLRAFAEFSRYNRFDSSFEIAKLKFNQPTFRGGLVKGGYNFR